MLPLLAAAVPAAVKLLVEYAPDVVRWVAGDKAGDVAEKVVGAAQTITGTSNPDDALEALKANPELAAKFRTDMAALEADLEKAYLADRQDARKRDVALTQAGHHNWRADIMLTLAFAGLIAIVYFTWSARLDMPDHVFAMLNMAVGMLLGMIKDAFQFEFGSSRGSKEKDLLRR